MNILGPWAFELDPSPPEPAEELWGRMFFLGDRIFVGLWRPDICLPARASDVIFIVLPMRFGRLVFLQRDKSTGTFHFP
jgi:hypothetical protein